jgi:hypothetical protein
MRSSDIVLSIYYGINLNLLLCYKYAVAVNREFTTSYI